MPERLTEFPDRRVWDLTGFTLSQICLHYQVTLLLCELGSSITVIIGNTFTLRVGERLDQMDPEQAMTLGPILPLLHGSVATLTAFRSGQLLLSFDGGAEIEVPKDDQYESWQTFGDGELAEAGMLCSPHTGSPWGG